MTNARDLDQLPEGIDAAFYIVTPDAFEDAAYEAAFVRGPRNLLRALISDRQSARRLIFVSSTSVYGQRAGEWVDETSQTAPPQFSGNRLLEGEHLVLESSIPGVVVRFGGIYGRNGNRLLQRVRDARPCQDTPPLYTNRIHYEDCVCVLHHLFDLQDPEKIYLGVDHEPAAQCVVMDWIAAQLGLPASPRAAPDDAGGGRRKTNKRCRNARLLSSGYRFVYPSFRDGYGALLAAMGDSA
jgi:nucleoside-diphosphate-sugar epimerase